jgi:hypothetical protein
MAIRFMFLRNRDVVQVTLTPDGRGWTLSSTWPAPMARPRATWPTSPTSSRPRCRRWRRSRAAQAPVRAGCLRSAAGRDPHDRDLTDLVGELSTQSDEFRTRWAAHNVRFDDTGIKEFHHPIVGEITLTYNRMELAADPSLAITIYTAEPGSKSAEALGLLGSWAATPQQPELQSAPDHP